MAKEWTELRRRRGIGDRDCKIKAAPSVGVEIGGIAELRAPAVHSRGWQLYRKLAQFGQFGRRRLLNG